jgi:hypothetical protein
MSHHSGGVDLKGGLDLEDPFFLVCILAISNPHYNPKLDKGEGKHPSVPCDKKLAAFGMNSISLKSP